jgi:hypothetical protein
MWQRVPDTVFDFHIFEVPEIKSLHMQLFGMLIYLLTVSVKLLQPPENGIISASKRPDINHI